MPTRPLTLGRCLAPAGSEPFTLAPHHLVTHGVVVGMTGSGKTGLCMVLVEEALRSRIPVLMVDVKGDLPNLLLTFPRLAPDEFLPWIDAEAAAREGASPAALATDLAARWREGLAPWGLGPADVAALRDGIAVRVITPGTRAGESLHVLSALETPSGLWELDEEAARESLAAVLSLLLRMIDHDGDPSRSREHVLLALLAERRLRAGLGAGLEALVADLGAPPLDRVGALALDDFLPAAARQGLAQDLNTLIASPTFGTWRQGAALDVGAWLTPRDGKTPAVIVSVAHLDDAERMLVLSLVLEQVLAWVRGLPGTSDLRALVLFDEVFGFLPPHPAAPPTKRPLLALLKQARAFGVGVVVATQNPMDLDYKALSNAGLWFVGRLQTDADRERVVEGLSGSAAAAGPALALEPRPLADVLKSLPPRTFYVRNVHDPRGGRRVETRSTLAWLRGPMTRAEIRRLLALPPTREMPAVTLAAAPVLPPGWRTWHAPAPAGGAPGAPGTWRYHPWVAARIVAHVRDARLGIQTTQTLLAMAPLGADGRPDTALGRRFDPQWFTGAGLPGAEYAALPEALLRKGGTAVVEKALRDEVYRTLQVTVQVHRELGLVSAAGEGAQAFARRCVVEAEQRAAAEREAVATRHAPRVQRQADRLAAARAALAAVEEASPVGSFMATTAAVFTGNKRALRRLETQQDRLAARREKARADVAQAEADHREAVARREAELAAAGQSAGRAAEAIETRSLGAKRTDIEVTEIGVAWVP